MTNCERCSLLRGRNGFYVGRCRAIASKPEDVRAKVNGSDSGMNACPNLSKIQDKPEQSDLRAECVVPVSACDKQDEQGTKSHLWRTGQDRQEHKRQLSNYGSNEYSA